MKLYTTKLAPNPRRVAWVMAEKNITDIEVIEVNLMGGEHRQPAYRDKFMIGHLPGLELDDGTCFTETVAIARYLEALYPEPNLLGVDPKETAIIEMWTRRAEIYLANPMMMFVRMTHPALSALETPVPEVGAYNKTTAEKFMKAMNRHLADNEYLAGRFSLADIVGTCGVDFGRMVKYRPPEEYEHLNRWLAACNARPAASAGLK
ncbi:MULTISPECIES: glutathione S-transferase family protein [unclassified Brevundimonas]|uniref:glutathione S-transferase family protein n=1 Tax=unclassified Brevundimonas TaxID=2622653 RepID=UPI0025C52809|nr:MULTISPECIES: glutathione S-transferase [unclassified Brevundimonas]